MIGKEQGPRPSGPSVYISVRVGSAVTTYLNLNSLDREKVYFNYKPFSIFLYLSCH